MLRYLSFKQDAFGLDISDLSLKIAKIKKEAGQFVLASFGEASIPEGVVEKGEIKKADQLAEIIKEAVSNVRGRPIKTKYVIASLPEEKAFLDVVQMPPLSEDELKEAVRYQAENYIPLSLKEAYFDFEKIQAFYSQPETLEVLVAAVPKNIVDHYLAALKMAGFQPLALEIESLAIARTLIKEEKTSQPVLIIDFGHTRTSFIIFSGYSLRFTSTIPISSQGLTKILARSLSITFNEAEELKLKYGLLGGKDYQQQAQKDGKRYEVFEALIPALTDLAEQIQVHLNYYHSHAQKAAAQHDGKEMSKILLCGEGSLLEGLVEFLHFHLKMPIELADPWVNISFKKAGLSFKESLGYATALGLALRGMKDSPQD